MALPLEASLSALGSYAVEATSCSDSLQDWSRFSLVTNDLVPLVHLRFSEQSLTKMNQGEVLSGRIQQGSTAILPTIIDLARPEQATDRRWPTLTGMQLCSRRSLSAATQLWKRKRRH